MYFIKCNIGMRIFVHLFDIFVRYGPLVFKQALETSSLCIPMHSVCTLVDFDKILISKLF